MPEVAEALVHEPERGLGGQHGEAWILRLETLAHALDVRPGSGGDEDHREPITAGHTAHRLGRRKRDRCGAFTPREHLESAAPHDAHGPRALEAPELRVVAGGHAHRVAEPAPGGGEPRSAHHELIGRREITARLEHVVTLRRGVDPEQEAGDRCA